MGWPVFALCGALAFAINWLAFIPAAIRQTEHYYDLTGGITYITTVGIAVWLVEPIDPRAQLVAAMVILWALRLSTFLFRRVSAAGEDSRFDVIKRNPIKFLLAWSLQGLWVLITASAAFAIITGGTSKPIGIFGVVGALIWVAGMVFEIVADTQKSRFRADPANEGKFIDSGLWAWSRHPNYFGEILLWLGIAIIAIPVLEGWRWATLISPVFVAVLLLKISGVPMLAAKADKTWGGQPDFEDYKKKTPVLIPRPPSR